MGQALVEMGEELRMVERMRPLHVPLLQPLMDACSKHHHLKKGETLLQVLRLQRSWSERVCCGMWRVLRCVACNGRVLCEWQLKAGLVNTSIERRSCPPQASRTDSLFIVKDGEVRLCQKGEVYRVVSVGGLFGLTEFVISPPMFHGTG